MVKCSFCGEGIKKGTGKIFVETSGSLRYFCSSKCQKNYDMKRKPAKVRWVAKKKAEEKAPVVKAKKVEAKPVEEKKAEPEKKEEAKSEKK